MYARSNQIGNLLKSQTIINEVVVALQENTEVMFIIVDSFRKDTY